MNKSDQLDQLYTALAKAQGEFRHAQESVKGNYSTYATLDDLYDATRDVLEKHGLSVSQGELSPTEWSTRLQHASGQWQEYISYIPTIQEIMLESKNKDNPVNFMQKRGSARSYLARYCYESMLGISTGNPDDEASEYISKPVNAQPVQQLVSDKCLLSHVQEIERKIKPAADRVEMKFEDLQKELLKGFKIESWYQLPQSLYKEVIVRLEDIAK